MRKRQTAQLLEVFERNQGRTLLTDVRTGAQTTYGEMLERSRHLASALAARGVRPGDAVAFSMDNCAELAALYFACMHAGARVVPINPTLHPNDCAAVLERISPRLFFTSTAVRSRLGDLAARHPRIEFLCLQPTAEAARADQAGLVNFRLDEEAARHAPHARTLGDAGDEDVFLTMFTSGSTGVPKGINMCYRGLLGNGRAMCQRFGLGRDSRFYNVLSMTYLGGLYNLFLIPTLAEGSLLLDVVFGPSNVFGFWENVRDHGVNTLWFSPTIMSMLLSLEGSDDLSFLKQQIRVALCGMAPLPVDVKRKFEERFGFAVYENYALSETLFLTTNAPDLVYKPGSVGKPLPGVTVEVLGPDQKPLGPGQEGQVVVTTPHFMKGYEQGADADSASLLPSGQFLTGDVGYLDPDGELVISGRLKDIIIRGGVNISPKSIEDVVYRLDGVQEAAVVGAPHPMYGEEVALVVRLRDSRRGTVTADDVRKFCDAHIAAFQRPKHIFFFDELPRGTTGKIHKGMLRKAVAERLKAG